MTAAGAPLESPQIRPAFTLVELLVVIGIIAVLIALLLPILSGAQRSARDIKCRSNMRQVCAALLNYAAENKGKFPPNVIRLRPPPPSPQPHTSFWSDRDRIGRYLRDSRVIQSSAWPNPHMIGAALVCPDDEGGSRSYSMNFLASSLMNTDTTRWEVGQLNLPTVGRTWGPGSKPASHLILLVESYSIYTDGHGTYVSHPYIPYGLALPPAVPRLNPGRAFVGYGRIHTTHNHGRYPQLETHVDWSRHRTRVDAGASKITARGRGNIGFADGHVQSYSPDDLADRATGRSKFVALWSPADYEVQERVTN